MTFYCSLIYSAASLFNKLSLLTYLLASYAGLASYVYVPLEQLSERLSVSVCLSVCLRVPADTTAR